MAAGETADLGQFGLRVRLGEPGCVSTRTLHPKRRTNKPSLGAACVWEQGVESSGGVCLFPPEFFADAHAPHD